MGVQDSEIAVELSGLTVGYRDRMPVLRDVSATLRGPGILLVEGPNGCGKSTLLEVLCGHLRPWSGSVAVCGTPPRSGRCRNVAVARTSPAFFPSVTLRDHCHLFARGTGMPLSALAAALRDLRLEGYLDEYPDQLSTGTQKKFWFVLHALQSAPVLAFDEPLNAVDRPSREWMFAALRSAAKRALVLVVTHEMPAHWRSTQPQPIFGDLIATRVEEQLVTMGSR